MCVVVKAKEEIDIYETEGGGVGISQTNEAMQERPSTIVIDIDDVARVIDAIRATAQEIVGRTDME